LNGQIRSLLQGMDALKDVSIHLLDWAMVDVKCHLHWFAYTLDCQTLSLVIFPS
jgi:hypothetical protein